MNAARWITIFALVTGVDLTAGITAGAQAPPKLAAGTQAPMSRRELVGIVRDSAGAGIEGATIQISGASAGSNPHGTFQLWTSNIDTVTILIRRLGYAPVTALLTARAGQWDTVVVEMERTSTALSAVTVTGSATRRALGLREFEERRNQGSGIFVTRDEIAARNTVRLTDILQSKRGIRVVRVHGIYGVRFAAYRSRANCSPNIWLDGVFAPDLEVDEILANDVEAMELYESFAAVPAAFTPRGSAASAACGTILIWTRIPGKAGE
jgi:hypothetical protein